MTAYAMGVVVGPYPTESIYGDVFVEIMTAHGPWYKPWIRYWAEVHTTHCDDPEWPNTGTHWYMYDFTAFTWRSALNKATSAMDDIIWKEIRKI